MFLFISLFVLSACGTGKSSIPDESKKSGDPLPPAEAEVTEGDFVYRLFTEKNTYDATDDIAIFAELTYTGELDSIDIYHAASPFYFPLEERTRGIKVDYAMNEPLLTTTLKKGTPFRQNYEFAGGYSDQDEKEYVNFVKTLVDDRFPNGEYIIHGYADFYTEDPAVATNTETFKIKSSIGFTVNK